MSLFKKICAVIVSELTLLSDDRLWSNPWLVVTAVMLMTCLWYIWVIWARKSIYDLFKFEILLLVQLIVQRIDIEVSLEFMDWAPRLLVEWLFNLLNDSFYRRFFIIVALFLFLVVFFILSMTMWVPYSEGSLSVFIKFKLFAKN